MKYPEQPNKTRPSLQLEQIKPSKARRVQHAFFIQKESRPKLLAPTTERRQQILSLQYTRLIFIFKTSFIWQQCHPKLQNPAANYLVLSREMNVTYLTEKPC